MHTLTQRKFEFTVQDRDARLMSGNGIRLTLTNNVLFFSRGKFFSRDSRLIAHLATISPSITNVYYSPENRPRLHLQAISENVVRLTCYLRQETFHVSTMQCNVGLTHIWESPLAFLNLCVTGRVTHNAIFCIFVEVMVPEVSIKQRHSIIINLL